MLHDFYHRTRNLLFLYFFHSQRNEDLHLLTILTVVLINQSFDSELLNIYFLFVLPPLFLYESMSLVDELDEKGSKLPLFYFIFEKI